MQTPKSVFAFCNLTFSTILDKPCVQGTSEGCESLIEATRTFIEDNGLYAIVNNAGVWYPGHAYWTDPKYYAHSLDVMVKGPIMLTYNLLPELKKTRGRIINNTSKYKLLLFFVVLQNILYQ